MMNITLNRINVTAAAQMGKSEEIIQFNDLVTSELTSGSDAEQITADQLCQSIEISELEKVLSIKVDCCLDQVKKIKKIYLTKALITAKNEGD